MMTIYTIYAWATIFGKDKWQAMLDERVYLIFATSIMCDVNVIVLIAALANA